MSPLEYLANKFGNVIKYDAAGNPSVFVKFPKMKSSDLDSELPDHTHPAFIVNGVEQDYILLGKYKATEETHSDDSEEIGTLLSLPNRVPVALFSAKDLINGTRKAGSSFTCMTVADYGFISLLARKLGWNPRGNTHGGSSRYGGGLPWQPFEGNVGGWPDDTTISEGNVCTFMGWEYECIKECALTLANTPDKRPDCFRKTRFVGGTPIQATPEGYLYYVGQGNLVGAGVPIIRTLNGSGPKSWYLNNDVGSMADLIGSTLELQAGYLVVDGEILILVNNNAADPSKNILPARKALLPPIWRAIKPNAGDNGYTLVDPGTSGTLHWNWDADNGKIILDTQTDNLNPSIPSNYYVNYPEDLGINSARVPYVPSIMKELRLFKLSGETSFSAPEFFGFSGTYVIYRGACSSDLQWLAPQLDRMIARQYDSSSDLILGARPRCLM